MTLIEQFEKESGMKYPKHDIQAQSNFDELYEEWLEKRCSFRDVSEKPIMPFLGLWSDGKMTVFDDANDNIDYAINAPIDKWKPAKLIKWMPLPIIERGTDAEP